MRVVITHFYNEEYLLPWWLKHHREIFDHGVLIDYRSTDRSVEICRELVPHWEIVQSVNPDFSAILADLEVMNYEMRFHGAWKIALNISEFLVAPRLASVERDLEASFLIGARFEGAIVVDRDPSSAPTTSENLTVQKADGVWERNFDFSKGLLPGAPEPMRSRVYHRYDVGNYSTGRHRSNLPGLKSYPREDGAIWWYGFAPWEAAFLKRKLQINSRRPAFDQRFGLGIQHSLTSAALEEIYASLNGLAGPLELSSIAEGNAWSNVCGEALKSGLRLRAIEKLIASRSWWLTRKLQKKISRL